MNLTDTNNTLATTAVHPDWAGPSMQPRPMFLHQSVDCPHCGAWFSMPCERPSDKPESFLARRSAPADKRKAVVSHKKRTDLVDEKMATEQFVIQLATDHGDFAEGDYFMATSNGDGTFSTIFRTRDGAPAGFTAPRHEVEFTCWADQMLEMSPVFGQ